MEKKSEAGLGMWAQGFHFEHDAFQQAIVTRAEMLKWLKVRSEVLLERNLYVDAFMAMCLDAIIKVCSRRPTNVEMFKNMRKTYQGRMKRKRCRQD